MQAAFANVDITPKLGTRKVGWIIDLVPDRILDPLHARIAVFRDAHTQAAIVQLDTLSVRWTTTHEIRRRVEQSFGIPGRHIMVAATHNHAGPAVTSGGRVPRDDAYVDFMLDRIMAGFAEALGRWQNAELGFATVFEFAVAYNRRVIMRDGTAASHGNFNGPESLAVEGPIDPEVAVLAVRTPEGQPLGCILNHASHPTHHGGDDAFSAGYPGVFARRMQANGWPTAMYLNGAFGNMHVQDPRLNHEVPMEEAGQHLAGDAMRAIASMSFEPEGVLSSASTTLALPYRAHTPDEVAGRIRGAQRFADPAWYDEANHELVRKIEERKTQPAEVHRLRVGEAWFVGIPAELFVEHGLRIKQACHPRRAVIVGAANGMVGYVPTVEAFARGGYETTFAPLSRLAPEAGDLISDAAIALVCQK